MCRQELFIAEGDLVEAYAVLLAGNAAPGMGQFLH